jgi:hypothetical protein
METQDASSTCIQVETYTQTTKELEHAQQNGINSGTDFNTVCQL